LTNQPSFRAQDLDAVDAKVLVFAWRHRHELGRGPSWHMVAKLAGWREDGELQERMHRLRNSNLVTFTKEPRSLTVSVAVARLAVERLRSLEGTT
jgi:hypothetical protein